MLIKQILKENYSKDWAKFKKLIEGDYSDAFKKFLNGNIIYKGLVKLNIENFKLLYPIDDRKSKNTANYYTVWMNNSPEWAAFPKRNIICTSDVHYASGFGKIYYIFPKNGTEIGICPENDIWVTYNRRSSETSSEWGVLGLFKRFNELFSEINGNFTDQFSYEDLLNNIKIFDDLPLDKKKEILQSEVGLTLNIDLSQKNSLLNYFNSLFSPEGFTHTTLEKYNLSQKNDDNNEIWFNNSFLAIDPAFFHSYSKELVYYYTPEEVVESQDAWLCYEYALNVIKGPFKAAENILSRSLSYGALYAKDCLNGDRFPLYEEYMKSHFLNSFGEKVFNEKIKLYFKGLNPNAKESFLKDFPEFKE